MTSICNTYVLTRVLIKKLKARVTSRCTMAVSPFPGDYSPMWLLVNVRRVLLLSLLASSIAKTRRYAVQKVMVHHKAHEQDNSPCARAKC